MVRTFEPTPKQDGRRTTRLLIADNRLAVRLGLQQLFATVPDIEVVGVVADGRQAVSHADQLRPDVVLMDVDMLNVDGVEAIRRISTTQPTCRVVILTASYDRTRVREALLAGAARCVTKCGCPDEVVRAVQDARLEGNPTENSDHVSEFRMACGHAPVAARATPGRAGDGAVVGPAAALLAGHRAGV